MHTFLTTPFVAIALIERAVKKVVDTQHPMTAAVRMMPACPAIQGRRRNRIIPVMFYLTKT